MGSLARHLRIAFSAAFVCGLLASPAPANEISAQGAASGIRVHGPEEVLRDYCTLESDGTLWFRTPGGSTWQLVTSTADPAIANPGDGSFHPYDESEIAAALAEVRFPLARLDVDIFVLPYPRRGALDSGAGPGLILLSPGVVPIEPARQHAELVHELGHVVQYRWLPDGDARWSEYRSRRGIEDLSTYSAAATHVNRPHEIFAEDFRVLFGGMLANYSGSIENASLELPVDVPGLEAFFLALVESAPLPMKLSAGANPARGPVTFALAGASDRPVDVFDVSGRRIATLAPAAQSGRTVWQWDGRDAGGTVVARGMLLARVRGEDGAAVRITWLP